MMIDSLKCALKKNRLSREINSVIKGIGCDLNFELNKFRFGDYWNGFSKIDVGKRANELYRDNLSAYQKRCLNAPLNIFFVGTYYDHEMQGFFQGLQKLGRVHTYINADGSYGINLPTGKKVDQKKWYDHLYQSVYQNNQKKQIDLIIGTFTAPNVPLEVLLNIRSLGIPIFNIAMDDMLPIHWRSEKGQAMGSFGLGAAVDLTLQTTPKMIPRYLKAGFPAIYFPFASDANIFRPAKNKDIDVLFIGNCYGKREKLFRKCVEAGISIEAYGLGFPNGHVSGNLVPSLFSRSKIILGSGLVGHSANLTTLKLRDFDGPMAGALYITTHSPLLEAHYKIGEEIETYVDYYDCINKIKYYLTRPDERNNVARKGRERARSEHTWASRLSVIREFLSVS